MKIFKSALNFIPDPADIAAFVKAVNISSKLPLGVTYADAGDIQAVASVSYSGSTGYFFIKLISGAIAERRLDLLSRDSFAFRPLADKSIEISMVPFWLQ